VERRTREIAIRVALGATRGEIVRLVCGECSLVTIAGWAIGLVGAFFASKLLKNLLYGVTSADFTAYFAATLLVLVRAGMAAILPSWRAARVDPSNSLRYE
jgi:putative ABC transport system permease protein